MFKKIEIWILYLTLVLVFISYIIFGAMVKREATGGGPHIPIITPISKIAYFFASIPSNLKRFKSPAVFEPNKIKEVRFNGLSGFSGDRNNNETYLLLSRFDGKSKQGIVELIDLKSWEVLFKWNPDFDAIWDNVNYDESNKWEYLRRDYNDSRIKLIHPIIYEDGSLLTQYNSPLVKINKDSKLIKLLDDEVYHHSIEKDIDNNIWVCVKYYPFKIDKKYVGNNYKNFRDDGIRKISNSGEVLFDKSVSEIFLENNMEHLLFGRGDYKYKKDPIHLNDIQPVDFNSKYWKKGDVFLSIRNQSMLILYRPETNQIIWIGSGKFFHQHDINILDESKIYFFNNNSKSFIDGGTVDGNNNVMIYDFETNKYSYYFENSFIKNDIRTEGQGRSRILPNGDLFVEESDFGRILYFNNDGSLRWTYVNKNEKDEIYGLGWSRILYKDEDIILVNEFLKQRTPKNQ